MIIETDEPMEIGKIYHGGLGNWLTDIDGNLRSNFALKVLRQATAEEYILYVREVGGILTQKCAKYFYEVSMD